MVNKKRIFLLVMFACTLHGVYANKPAWISNLPIPTNKTYGYKVTHAEAKTYDEAYSKALARAILETSWKITGVTVKVNDDLGNVEQNITKSLKTITKEVRIHINKVCEYSDRPTSSMQIHVYILWQIPIDGYTTPKFEQYNCE